MKIISLLLLLVLAGCATHRIESRKKEKRAAYQSLNPQFKALVDGGQITDGMSEDAVYVALGKPTEILEIEDARGPASKWLYKGTYEQEQKHPAMGPQPFGTQTPPFSTLDVYNPQSYGRHQPLAVPRNNYTGHDYVKVEVDFLNGVVRSWRMKSYPR